MANNIQLNAGVGGDVLAATDRLGVKHQRVIAEIGDCAINDSFSRLRVSSPYSLFESKFRYDLLPLRFNAITANSGAITHLPNESSAQLATAAVASSSAILCTKQHIPYVPGKSQLVFITGVMRAAVANVVKRVGYFEENDGIFLEQNGTTDVAFVRRTSTSGSPVDNRVVQDSWNLDPLNGSGPSGITLDLTKAYIIVIDFQWLGMGRVRVGFDIDGVVVYAHQMIHANNLTTVYMKTADLPVRWEIAGNGVATMQATCCTVISEGGFEQEGGMTFSTGTNLTARTFSAGTPLPIVALRPKTTFNSIENSISFSLESFSWLPTSGTADFRWQILYNPAITGGAWDDVDATNSAMEKNITGTAVTGGIVIASGYDSATSAQRALQSASSLQQRYPWCLDKEGNQIVIALVMTEVSGSTAAQATMTWRERR